MSDSEEVDLTTVDWEEQIGEMEALEVIFPDEFKILQSKPYEIEIQINSNVVKEENHLKMLLLAVLKHDYPHRVPFLRLKNLSPDYLDNRMIDKFETEIRFKTHELVGSPMMFDICEHLREAIAEINDKVLGKFNKIVEQKLVEEKEAKQLKFSNTQHLNYTPVNQETFSKWCKEFLAALKFKEDAEKTDQD